MMDFTFLNVFKNQLYTILRDPNRFQFIARPTEFEQLAGVSMQYDNMKYINKYSSVYGLSREECYKNLQKVAFYKKPKSLRYMYDIPDDLKWIAIKRDLKNVKYIYQHNDLTEEMQLYILSKDRRMMEQICKNCIPSLTVQIESVKLNPNNISYIFHAVEELDKQVLDIALERSQGNVIVHLNTASDEMKMYIIQKYPRIIGKVYHPTEEMCLLALEKDPEAVVDDVIHECTSSKVKKITDKYVALRYLKSLTKEQRHEFVSSIDNS